MTDIDPDLASDPRGMDGQPAPEWSCPGCGAPGYFTRQVVAEDGSSGWMPGGAYAVTRPGCVCVGEGPES
jgi:hypothetical protein